MTCNCDMGMCFHRSDCKKTRRSQPTDRDGNAVRHGTQDKLNRLRRRVDIVRDEGTKAIIKGILDLLEDEL